MKDGGMLDGLKRMVGMAPPETMIEKFARQDAARAAARSAPAPQVPAPETAAPMGSQGVIDGRMKAAGLRDGGSPAIDHGQGGKVPGHGQGDKIPAKYEPGEFVVSNAMLEAEPALRKHLTNLRNEVLVAQGKDPEAVDEGQLRKAGLRADSGAWIPKNPNVASGINSKAAADWAAEQAARTAGATTQSAPQVTGNVLNRAGVGVGQAGVATGEKLAQAGVKAGQFGVRGGKVLARSLTSNGNPLGAATAGFLPNAAAYGDNELSFGEKAAMGTTGLLRTGLAIGGGIFGGGVGSAVAPGPGTVVGAVGGAAAGSALGHKIEDWTGVSDMLRKHGYDPERNMIDVGKDVYGAATGQNDLSKVIGAHAPVMNQSDAETARLARSGTGPVDQNQAETNRLGLTPEHSASSGMGNVSPNASTPNGTIQKIIGPDGKVSYSGSNIGTNAAGVTAMSTNGATPTYIGGMGNTALTANGDLASGKKISLRDGGGLRMVNGTPTDLLNATQVQLPEAAPVTQAAAPVAAPAPTVIPSQLQGQPAQAGSIMGSGGGAAGPASLRDGYYVPGDGGVSGARQAAAARGDWDGVKASYGGNFNDAGMARKTPDAESMMMSQIGMMGPKAAAAALAQVQQNKTTLRGQDLNYDATISGHNMTRNSNLARLQYDMGKDNRDFTATRGDKALEQNQAADKAWQEHTNSLFQQPDGKGGFTTNSGKSAQYTAAVDDTLGNLVSQFAKSTDPAARAHAADLAKRGRAALDAEDKAALAQLFERQQMHASTVGVGPLSSGGAVSRNLLDYKDVGKDRSAWFQNRRQYAGGQTIPMANLERGADANYILPNFGPRSNYLTPNKLRGE
jgi:hypothetical protein